MSWQDLALIASPLLSALTAGVAAWWAAWQAIDRKLEHIRERQTLHSTRIAVAENEIRSAHRRINDIVGRPSRQRDA